MNPSPRLTPFGWITIWCILFWAIVFAMLTQAFGNMVKFAWNPNPEPDISHYVITYGTESGNRTQSVNTGNVTTYTVGGLENSTTYYFALQAVNTSGLISLPTDEISHTTAAPPPSNGILVMPRKDWVVTASSELGAKFVRGHTFDAKADTFWHTKRETATPAELPHWLAVDFGSEQPVKGFRFTPRRPEDDTSSQARLNEWKLYLSNDGQVWGEAVAQGDFPNDTELKEYLLPEAITARHLKVEMVSAHGEPPPYAWAVAEFYALVVDPDFVEPPPPPPPPDPKPPEPPKGFMRIVLQSSTDLKTWVDLAVIWEGPELDREFFRVKLEEP
jgi:hypothetical protein